MYCNLLIIVAIIWQCDAGTELEHDCEPMKDEVSLELQRQCQGAMPAGEVRLGGTVITRTYCPRAEEMLDLEVKEDDIWVISFPKSGTTWTQEMVWLLKNNLDFKKAKDVNLPVRYSFLEYKLLCGENSQDVPDLIEIFKTSKSPRFIKTHLPVHLLPKQIWTKKSKIIYVARNPRDVAISYFHHFKFWNNYKGSQELFIKAFVEDKVVFSPYWGHVLAYWKRREETNVLFITFEEMKKDLPSIIKRTAIFLEVGLPYNSEQETELLDHLSFSSMKTNKAVNLEEDYQKRGQVSNFIRQGEVGGWMRDLTPEQKNEFDDWTVKNLEETDYPH